MAWFDAGTRETKRTSLETADLETAKAAAARLITTHGDLHNARPEIVTLAQVFNRYHEHHGKALRAGREQLRHMRYWRDFFGANATVADLHPARQHAFVEHLRRNPYKSGTIKRVLASGAAALRWCYHRGELQSVPHVVTVADSEPRERVLQTDEIRALWGAIQAPKLLELRRYVMILLEHRLQARGRTRSDRVPGRSRPATAWTSTRPVARARPQGSARRCPITNALRPWLQGRRPGAAHRQSTRSG